MKSVAPHSRSWASGLVILLLLGLFLSASAAPAAANPPPVQTFYIPFPEDQVLQSLRSIYPGPTACGQPSPLPANPVQTYVSISIISDGTIIYYDHWEDGYEVDVTNPTQPSTQIWGDGDPSNGAPPGIPGDLLTADTVIVLNNPVNTAQLGSTLYFDGRDRISSTRLVAMTRAAWASDSGTLLAGALEVYDTFRWGRSFQAPVGEDVEVATQLFEYTGMTLMAGTDNTTIAIDANADGTVDLNLTLDRGDSYLVDGGIRAGATVEASAPIQVALITGDRCDIYESRWYVLFPNEQWSASYYNPVGTPAGDRTRVFLFNPTNSPLTVNWTTTGGAQTPLTVPARGTASATMPDNSGAHFFTPDGTPFVGIAAVGSGGTAGGNSRADWGFSLVPEEQLTGQVLVGWGPGRDPTSSVNPSENGSPVWVTPVLPNGGAGPVDLCVDYRGDGAGPLTDSQGLRYDLLLSLNRLQSAKVFDPSGDQTGMVIYVCDTDPVLAESRIVAAWGQAPGIASAAEPGLDLGVTIPPAASFFAGKGAALAADPDQDDRYSPGDTVTFTILIGNASRIPVDTFVISDTVPAHTSYVLNSTFFDNGGSVQPIADAGVTPFPLDEGGITLTDPLPVQGTFTVTFQVVIDNPFPLDLFTVQNTASVLFDREEANPTVEIPVERRPEIVIEKATNGVDADSPPGLYVRPGDPITWTYRITNTGPISLTGISVTDSVAGVTPVYVSGDVGNDGVLEVGESWLYQAAGVAVGGPYANVGTVNAGAANGDTASDTDPSHYFGAVPGLSLGKSAQPTVILSGEAVTYTVTVTNTGNAPLGNLSVLDDQCLLTPVTQSGLNVGDVNQNGNFDPGEVWRYTCTVPVSVDTLNTAVATAMDPFGETLTASDTATVDVIRPALALDKVVDRSIVYPGTVVTYTFTVTNAGDVPLANVNLVDDQCSPVSFVDGDANSDTLLDVTETWRYRCTATILTDTLNVATVTAIDPLGNPLLVTDSATVAVIRPALGVEKVADQPVALAGSTVTYTYTVVNLGDVPIGDVTVTDDLCSPVTYVDGDVNSDDLLDLTEIWRYRCSTTLLTDTLNVATVTGTDPLGGGLVVTDTATVDVISPLLAVAKSADQSLVLSGTLVTYAYTVTNPGDVPLTDVSVTDDKCSPVTFLGVDANDDDRLDVGEIWRYTCAAVLGQDTVNTATATATDPLGNGLTVTATASVDVVTPAIGLDKVGSATGVLPGQVVTYTYTVTNPGDVPLSNITLTDDKCSPVTFLGGDGNGDSLLDPNETWLYRCVATIHERTLNTAVVTGTTPFSTTVSAQDSFLVTLNIVYVPIIIGPPPPDQECPPPDGCPVDGVHTLKGIAVDESRDHLYITSQGNNRLVKVDARTVTTLGQVPTHEEPWGVVVDEADRRVYVSHYASGDVWVYDADSLAVLARIPVGGRPGLMAILPELNTVMVVVGDGSRVAVIRGIVLAQTLSAVGAGPYGIAADPVKNQFFISNRESGHLVAYVQDGVTDGSRWVRVTGPVLNDGRTLFHMAYNPDNEKLYVVYARPSGEWFVDVWKADVGNAWGLIFTIPVDSGGELSSPLVGGSGIGVNRATANLFNVNTGAATLTVVNGTDNGIRAKIDLGADPFPLAVDQIRNIVYVGLRSSARLVKVMDTYR